MVLRYLGENLCPRFNTEQELKSFFAAMPVSPAPVQEYQKMGSQMVPIFNLQLHRLNKTSLPLEMTNDLARFNYNEAEWFIRQAPYDSLFHSILNARGEIAGLGKSYAFTSAFIVNKIDLRWCEFILNDHSPRIRAHYTAKGYRSPFSNDDELTFHFHISRLFTMPPLCNYSLST